MPDCPVCGEQRFNLDAHIARVHPPGVESSPPVKVPAAKPEERYRSHFSKADLLKAEAKITPDRIQTLMARLQQRYGKNFITGKFP